MSRMIWERKTVMKIGKARRIPYSLQCSHE